MGEVIDILMSWGFAKEELQNPLVIFALNNFVKLLKEIQHKFPEHPIINLTIPLHWQEVEIDSQSFDKN